VLSVINLGVEGVYVCVCVCVCIRPDVSFVCRVLDEVLQKLVHLVQEEECVSVLQAYTHLALSNTHAGYKSFLMVWCITALVIHPSFLHSLSFRACSPLSADIALLDQLLSAVFTDHRHCNLTHTYF